MLFSEKITEDKAVYVTKDEQVLNHGNSSTPMDNSNHEADACVLVHLPHSIGCLGLVQTGDTVLFFLWRISIL